MRVILAPGTTDAVTSNQFTVAKGQQVTVMLYPEANLGADTAVLKMVAPDGTLVAPSEDGTDIVFDADRPIELLIAVGTYVLTAATRTAAWGIAIEG